MSFNNTILDSLANSLVITASGGGTHVIPFLTVYAVWPCSFLFLLAYSAATQRLSRQALFNAVLGAFLAFYAAFGCAYPNHDALHFGEQAASAAAALPAGLAGLVGMVRNWSFTLFYCAAELWGDVVLSLLFWGLANETTALDEAPALYPMFGLGANVGQAASGRALALFHRATDGVVGDGAQVQCLMAAVVACGCVVLSLHAYIVGRWPVEGSQAALRKEKRRLEKEGERAKKERAEREKRTGVVEVEVEVAAVSTAPPPDAAAAAAAPRAPPPSLKEAFTFLAASPAIRCLAVMALSQVRSVESFFRFFFCSRRGIDVFDEKNTSRKKKTGTSRQSRRDRLEGPRPPAPPEPLGLLGRDGRRRDVDWTRHGLADAALADAVPPVAVARRGRRDAEVHARGGPAVLRRVRALRGDVPGLGVRGRVCGDREHGPYPSGDGRPPGARRHRRLAAGVLQGRQVFDVQTGGGDGLYRPRRAKSHQREGRDRRRRSADG
jgi:hypothetical protein